LCRSSEDGWDEGEAVDIGGIQGYQHGIKGKPPHRFEENGRVVVAGKTKETHPAFLLCLQESLESATSAKDTIEIRRRAQIVQLPQVEVIRPQAPEAILQQS
jgi:hypothetical protein